MPGDLSDAPLMRSEIDGRFSQGRGDATVGYLPDFHCAILRATGNDVVIVWTPGEIEHGGFVPADQGHLSVDAANFLQWQNEKGTTATRLGNNSQELRIHRAKGRVPGALGDANIIVAIGFLRCLTEDMASRENDVFGRLNGTGHTSTYRYLL